MSRASHKILLVDDEPELRESIVDYLGRDGHHVTEASCGRDAIELLGHDHMDLVITDVRMVGGGGIELLKEIGKMPPPRPEVILISGFFDISEVEARNLGAAALLQKPFDLSAVSIVIDGLGTGNKS